MEQQRVADGMREPLIGVLSVAFKSVRRAQAQVITLTQHGHILLQGSALVGKSLCQLPREGVVALGKAECLACDGHAVEAVGIEPLPG